MTTLDPSTVRGIVLTRPVVGRTMTLPIGTHLVALRAGGPLTPTGEGTWVCAWNGLEVRVFGRPALCVVQS